MFFIKSSVVELGIVGRLLASGAGRGAGERRAVTRKLAMLDSAQQSGRSEFGVGADHVRRLLPIMRVGALAMVRPLAQLAPVLDDAGAASRRRGVA